MNNTIHSGYVSDQAKRTFTISAGVLGAIFFFAQFIVPFILMMAFTLMVFSEGSWQVRQSFSINRMNDGVCCARDIQIISDQQNLHFFMKSGNTIFYHPGLPAGPEMDRKSWHPVVEAGSYWYTILTSSFLSGTWKIC